MEITLGFNIAKFAINQILERSLTNIHLDGRFSPHKNFINDLEYWCTTNNLDFNSWRKLVADKTFNYSKAESYNSYADILNSNLQENKEKLNLK